MTVCRRAGGRHSSAGRVVAGRVHRGTPGTTVIPMLPSFFGGEKGPFPMPDRKIIGRVPAVVVRRIVVLKTILSLILGIIHLSTPCTTIIRATTTFPFPIPFRKTNVVHRPAVVVRSFVVRKTTIAQIRIVPPWLSHTFTGSPDTAHSGNAHALPDRTLLVHNTTRLAVVDGT